MEKIESVNNHDDLSSDRVCAACHAKVGKAKFCPECATPIEPPRPTCEGCGHQPEGTPKFCPECGAQMSETS
ncbi:MAG: hypothetical protein LC754_09885 [Acidobacteria bacterium]|nr:hypothetical protein [Acidobacteriota bacterium]